MEARASSCVQQNIIKLSNECGTLFDGLEEEVESLFEKLNQRRKPTQEATVNSQLVPQKSNL